ncbi:MAG TPA: radical SAM family heme chaperone HemW [Thermoanaerobaculaceae bacterium]|nr:radical SAM family heme chaperone HemW [Thermoanaerobaculaceae bacterium]HRS16198.1 radical SAM family heme chaperone HemW [Thermoanaerobaculaceae bacterium]
MTIPPQGQPGLYLHLPFCSAICPYCDFAVMRAGEALRARFVDRLVAELPLAAGAWADPRPFDTVYFGGGTPSLLMVEELARLLDACREHLALTTPAPWVFLEANPEDVTPEVCRAWRRLGVRTLSLGVQSFDDGVLRFLGRRHTAAKARAAVEKAKAAGFDTVSIDLIFGLPGQSAAAWRRELATAVALAPDHLSCYQLTIHPRTVFGVRAARGQLSELPEGAQAALFELTHRVLADAGWPAYEVSNFARSPEHRSRHNCKYWNHTPYLGLGPSAHSFAIVPHASAGTAGAPVVARRWWNEPRLRSWEQRMAAGERPLAGEEALGPRELGAETLLLGLRTTAGVDLDDFATRFGVDLLAANALLVANLAAEGRLEIRSGPDGRRLVPTLQGLAVADGVAAAFDLPIPT